MGIRILSLDGGGATCLFDSTTGWAFGPVAEEDVIMSFLKWCAETDVPDLRTLAPGLLEAKWTEFLGTTRVDHGDLSLVPDED